MAGRLKLGDLISRTYGMYEVNTAIEVLDRGEAVRSIIRY